MSTTDLLVGTGANLRRLGGIKPPYLPKINEYPLSPLSIFGMNE